MTGRMHSSPLDCCAQPFLPPSFPPFPSSPFVGGVQGRQQGSRGYGAVHPSPPHVRAAERGPGFHLWRGRDDGGVAAEGWAEDDSVYVRKEGGGVNVARARRISDRILSSLFLAWFSPLSLPPSLALVAHLAWRNDWPSFSAGRSRLRTRVSTGRCAHVRKEGGREGVGRRERNAKSKYL